MQKRWKIYEADAAEVTTLFNSLKVHTALCKILVERGIKTYEKAKQYFRPQLSDLHDPWLMKDMQNAVARIQSAIERNERILVFGDYDVDGTTAVACMYRFLKKVYSDIDFYIPHRYKEGYGVSKLGIDFAHENNFSLIISLDCGSPYGGLLRCWPSLIRRVPGQNQFPSYSPPFDFVSIDGNSYLFRCTGSRLGKEASNEFRTIPTSTIAAPTQELGTVSTSAAILAPATITKSTTTATASAVLPATKEGSNTAIKATHFLFSCNPGMRPDMRGVWPAQCNY